MNAPGLSLLVGAIGPTGFTLLVWGALLLVVAAFGYVVWTLLVDRREN